MRDLSLGVGAVLETRVVSRNLNLKRKIVFSKFVYLVGETALKGIKFQGKNRRGIYRRCGIQSNSVKSKRTVWMVQCGFSGSLLNWQMYVFKFGFVRFPITPYREFPNCIPQSISSWVICLWKNHSLHTINSTFLSIFQKKKKTFLSL